MLMNKIYWYLLIGEHEVADVAANGIQFEPKLEQIKHAGPEDASKRFSNHAPRISVQQFPNSTRL